MGVSAVGVGTVNFEQLPTSSLGAELRVNTIDATSVLTGVTSVPSAQSAVATPEEGLMLGDFTGLVGR